MSVGYQSFYQAQLTAGISDADLTIPLDVAPSPSEGFLVIESTVTDKREIIYYTSKTPTSVTCPSGGRGYDGTTATTHQQNAVVIMAPVGAMFDELRTQFTTTPQGWTSVVPTITDVTNNGNRSYTLTHSASVASVISEGMRRRFQRTVASNTYMGGLFNGSSHYFTKTTPSGTLGTVTNNFTIEAYVQPTSYASGYICARGDSGGNNGFGLKMESDGRVNCLVYAAAGSFRQIASYQSLPLNKKTHVSASWTSGTVVIYFDGVAVPMSAASTGGTAPTVGGTGGDWSVGRQGAYNGQYFPGYISNVAVFDAVLSAATIREHAKGKLLGNETNCIGAWSLDNTPNDQNSAGNNLTATGGVGFSNVSPFGNNGKSSTLEYGLTMSVSSDGLTEVVQVPEGCALPTAITSQDYSTQGNPFGWPGIDLAWEVRLHQNFSVATATQTQVPGASIYIPEVMKNKKLRIMASGAGLWAGAPGGRVDLVLWDGVVASGASLNSTWGKNPDVSGVYGFYLFFITPPIQSGTKTYNLGLSLAVGGGSGQVAGATANPLIFRAEVIQ